MGAIAANVAMQAGTPGGPGLFRCAAHGVMTSVYRDAGLKNIVEKEVDGELAFDTPEEYWGFMTDIAAPVVSGLARTDEATRERIRLTVLDLAQQSSADGRPRFQWSALAICGGT